MALQEKSGHHTFLKRGTVRCQCLISHTCIPSYLGGRRIVVPSLLRQIFPETLFRKYPTQKRAG
jgi:hypothetical protein